MLKKGFGPQEGSGKRAERREKREERRENREGRMNREDNSTHGIEEKHDQDERVE